MRALPMTSLAVALVLGLPVPLKAQGKAKPPTPASPLEAMTTLPLRAIGPALTSGRVVDIAVDPRNGSTWYVATASSGVWKTTNAGTTWTSVFDKEGASSIGCVTLDPKDPQVIWVGSGENNSQRSVGLGDGVYRSQDGGKTWENLGLKLSEHIAKIVVDPRDSKVVFVAAQGPLWNAGGDRGLYKTVDGGKTWKRVLAVSEHTGVTDLVQDPRNPDVLYAAAYQRRRHVWTLIDGGPESGIHKSTDGGQTWTQLKEGLPKAEMGRIGLALSPQNPDVVYATIEAANKAGGFFSSSDKGANWEKQNGWVSGAAQYYQELFPDPNRQDRIYAMDTWMQVSEDGGKTWKRVGEKFKHVDNHALWIDPANSEHLISGCDGGLYETWDRGAHWLYKANLPILQFYRVATDNAKPFYNVYGGTQDNFSLGGPSRTRNRHGITNQDWFTTQFGDGFYSQVDPEDPNTVYSESQHGGLGRYDRRTGEVMDIQPQPAPGEEPFRWNWDSPLLLSPHKAQRLYFAANKLFRTEDKGSSWTAVSPDLTRRIDRNTLKVMGKVWSVDAVAKNSSTSNYGNIVALSESPKQEGLLYVGTDDGLVQVSEDGGKAWRKQDKFPGVPDLTYVSCLSASPHDVNQLFAAFNNQKQGDYKPYVLRSRDKGRTWESIAGNLPARGQVHVVKEDPARAGLLYAGTEFGLFVSLDAGQSWNPMKELPTTPVKDLTIQSREGDLVIATFGRGFWILDDLTALREAKPEFLEQEAHLFGLRPALAYMPASPLGFPGYTFQGEGLYAAANPPFGAVFTYHLKAGLQSRKKQRQEQEKALEKAGGEVRYPSWDALRAEDREAQPAVVLTITGPDGHVVRRLTGPSDKGLHRLAWDLRLPSPDPVQLKAEDEKDPWESPNVGTLAAPGTYTARLAFKVDGALRPVGEPQRFEVKLLDSDRISAQAAQEMHAFAQKATELQRLASNANAALTEGLQRLDHLQKAALETPGAPTDLLTQAQALTLRLKGLKDRLQGDETVAARQEPTAPGILDRVGRVVSDAWSLTEPLSATHSQNLKWAEDAFTQLKPELKEALEKVEALDQALGQAGAPHTPGRKL